MVNESGDPRNAPALRGRVEQLEIALLEIVRQTEAYPRDWRVPLEMAYAARHLIDRIHNIARDALRGSEKPPPELP